MVLLSLAFAAMPALASAHARSHSYSSWRLNDAGARVTVRLARVELTRVGLGLSGHSDPSQDAAIAAYLVEHLELRRDGLPCPRSRLPLAKRAVPDWISLSWTVVCPAGGRRSLHSSILLDEAPGHLHFTRVALPGGPVLERVLSRAEPSWELHSSGSEQEPADGSTSTGGTTLGGYLALGARHILGGWDHLAFVLALLLLSGSLTEVARLVTGFTLGHSLTLALAVLGWLQPEPRAVEALIGFSVALVAAENAWILVRGDWRVPACITGGLALLAWLAWLGAGTLSLLTLLGLALFCLCHFALLARTPRPSHQRAALSFAFGLVHGFGFAGVLFELSLPSERLAPALFGFNAGVELGQLGAVAIAWPLLELLRRGAHAHWHRFIAEFGSAAICGLGVFWFVTRSFGAG